MNNGVTMWYQGSEDYGWKRQFVTGFRWRDRLHEVFRPDAHFEQGDSARFTWWLTTAGFYPLDGMSAKHIRATDNLALETILRSIRGGETLEVRRKTLRVWAPKISSGQVRITYPEMDRDFVFLQFAEIKNTEEDLLSFCQRWGPLFGGIEKFVSDAMPEEARKVIVIEEEKDNPFEDDAGAGSLFYGVDASEYLESHREYNTYFSIWQKMCSDWSESDAIAALKQLGHQDKFFERHRDWKVYCEERFRAKLNSALLESSPQIVRDAAGEKKIRPVPKDLLSFMWLQLAQAYLGNKSFTVCQQCDKWYETGHDGRISSKRFCSDACRMRAYRRRKKAV